jgi:hypothetical protein
MKWYQAIVVFAVVTAAVIPATAGGLFSKKTAPTSPADRVQQLLQTITSSSNPNARVDAVADLRDFDVGAHPQIVPVLVNALKTDSAVNVRIEAARSLGRIRPLTQMAGDALSTASLGDSHIRVRWQARASLMVYTVAGINPGNHAPQNSQTDKTGKAGDPNTVPFPSGSPVGQPPILVPSSGNDVFRPLPKGPAQIIPVSPGNGGPTTVEPPLAPNVPQLIQPPAYPVNPGLPVVPAPPQANPVPILVPQNGPILNPPM